VGYVTIPEDWTDKDYQLIEILDGGAAENKQAQNKPHTDWYETVSRLNSHTEVRTDFEQYVIIRPQKGARQEPCICGTSQASERTWCKSIIKKGKPP
jgi:hypothetical protein